MICNVEEGGRKEEIPKDDDPYLDMNSSEFQGGFCPSLRTSEEGEVFEEE